MYKFLFFVLLLPVVAAAQPGLSLDGDWTFAMDPMRQGEVMEWPKPGAPYEHFDKVKVPHCFSVDPRYELYTGTAWYFRKFGGVGGVRQWLHFDAVYYRSKVFLNGEPVGEHEGGYTPFELEVTGRVRDENFLAVEVDNSWDTTTIPGAKTRVAYQSDNMGFFFPWINYGGITRHVRLVTRPAVYVERIKVIAEPDIARRSGRVRIVASLSGAAAAVEACVFRDGEAQAVGCVSKKGAVAGPNSFDLTIAPKDCRFWDQDHPNMYRAVVRLGSDTFATAFGIRQMRVQGTRLLLNGEPVRFGGANRPIDYPGFGSMDPQAVIDKDLGLMKSGCMEMSRIIHYPVSDEFLDWADHHGLMIIEEAGNWQMTPKQLADPVMRRKFESQMKEMVERDWNHPCVVAWSVGNEFQSQTPEGKSWVVDMSRYVKTMDETRLITFASMMVARDIIKKPEDEASQYVDFISSNMYGDYLKRLQHIHSVYPDKPVFVSEFGIRTDGVKDESGRVAHLREAMEAFRQCSDFVIGASVWTFNDYLSRFPGTNPNGYRPWGLVGPDREPRGMYIVWQEEFAPATLEPAGSGAVRITARKDFPSYVLRDYSLRCGGVVVPVPVLRPGESKEIALPSGGAGEVDLVKPGGFVILKKIFNR